MKKKHPQPEKASTPTQEKSFSVALEQIAQLLRTEVKLKDRDTKVLSSSSMPHSFNIAIGQIAKLLRTQVHVAKPTKTRSWKAASKDKKTKDKK